MKSSMPPLFQMPEHSDLSLRDQICEIISTKIASGVLREGFRLPSCRQLAQQFAVSRNTVHGALASLAERGFVVAIPRSGYLVRGGEAGGLLPELQDMAAEGAFPDFQFDNAALPHVKHPHDWAKYPFPFVYNQTDPRLFPLTAWRECTRQAQSRGLLREWTSDSIDGDSPRLIEQIRQRLLLQRGIAAREDDILVTLGSQSALTLLGLVFRHAAGVIAVEEPGFPEARNAFSITGNTVIPVPVDDKGLIPELVPLGTKLIYTTPSHQFPSSVALTLERRIALLEKAKSEGFFICEDDYEPALGSARATQPTLKSLDRTGHVIYLSSFSKTLSPGLRLGFMVVPPQLRNQLVAVRRIVMRHVPTLMQETAATFLALGLYEPHVRRHEATQKAKWNAMARSIRSYLQDFEIQCSNGGSSFWLTGREGFDSSILGAVLLRKGVIIDPGATFYFSGGEKSFRLGFAAIDIEAIERGIEIIAHSVSEAFRRASG